MLAILLHVSLWQMMVGLVPFVNMNTTGSGKQQ